MATAWKITDWRERYEVTPKGRPAGTDAALRISPLPYVRLFVHGRAQGAGWRRLQQATGTSRRLALAFAVFCKLLELAADQPRDLRGWILTENGEPATAADIAFFTGFLESDITNALDSLCDDTVGWVARADSSHLQETPPNSKELQVLLEPNRTELNETEPEEEPNTTEPNRTEGDAGEETPAAPASVPRDERELRGDSVSASDNLLGSRDGIAFIIQSKLGLKINRAMRQGRADLTTLRYLADHIMHGDFGSPVDSKLEVYSKAAEIVADANANSKMAVLMAWVHKQLEVAGHTWKKF